MKIELLKEISFYKSFSNKLKGPALVKSYNVSKKVISKSLTITNGTSRRKKHLNILKTVQRWQKNYPPLKRYNHDRYRFYFIYFKYQREIRGMIYTTNRIERLNRDDKRVINMRGTMPNPKAVILLMGTVAQNADIYNFLQSRLFY